MNKTTLLIFLLVLATASCRQTPNRSADQSNDDVPARPVRPSQTGANTENDEVVWSTTPNANSTRIKVSTNQPSSVINTSVTGRLRGMGFGIERNTPGYIESRPLRTESDNLRIKVWIEGSDIIFLAEKELTEPSDFGLEQSSGFEEVRKGTSTHSSEGWRTLERLFRGIEGTRTYR